VNFPRHTIHKSPTGVIELLNVSIAIDAEHWWAEEHGQ
jgi:hypothetical protein